MRLFTLVRLEDVSGTSGVGAVAEGAMFTDGTCALRWLTKTRSSALYARVADVLAIHGHEGRTIISFVDGQTVRQVRVDGFDEMRLQTDPADPRGWPNVLSLRGVDFPCEGCGELAGSRRDDGWMRCRKCGYPGK